MGIAAVAANAFCAAIADIRSLSANACSVDGSVGRRLSLFSGGKVLLSNAF
jgi:hypothetical protein